MEYKHYKLLPTSDTSIRSVSATRLHDEELGFPAQQRTVAVVEELVDVLHVDGLAVSSVHHTVLTIISSSLTNYIKDC